MEPWLASGKGGSFLLIHHLMSAVLTETSSLQDSLENMLGVVDPLQKYTRINPVDRMGGL